MSTSRNGLPADDRARVALAALAPEPPAWAVEHFAGALRTPCRPRRLALVGTDIPDCASLDAAALERAVGDAYRVVAESLGASGHHPVRFWNFVPGIHADMGGGRDRYMVFNAGRYAAFEDGSVRRRCSPARCRRLPRSASAPARWRFTRWRPRRRSPGREPAPGAGLPLLGALRSAAAVLRARHHRARLAVRPPAADAPVLLVGGTASIVGEDSLHDRDARQQALETFENLAELVAAARRQVAWRADAPTRRGPPSTRSPNCASTSSATATRRSCARWSPSGSAARRAIEFAQADLCRRELLVEIEGVATL